MTPSPQKPRAPRGWHYGKNWPDKETLFCDKCRLNREWVREHGHGAECIVARPLRRHGKGRGAR